MYGSSCQITGQNLTVWLKSSWKRRSWTVMKSMPLSVKAAEPSRPPDLSFLSNTGRLWTMGVLNITPNSFYAESRVPQAESALRTAEKMITEGADVLDLGGEST